MQLTEKYRPTQWSEVVGQPEILAKLAQLRSRAQGQGIAGRAYFLTGKSGTGKTTIARLLAQEIASEFNIIEIDGGDCGVDEVRDWERCLNTFGMPDHTGKTGRAYIINEAHGLKQDAIRKLCTLFESSKGGIPSHYVFIFTTTLTGADSMIEKIDFAPLLSRNIRLNLAQRDLAKPFAERARSIAKLEGIGSDLTVDALVKLVNKHGANFRAVLQELETL